MDMSIELLESEIFRFLKSENPEVLAIRGDWGIGKTYEWNNCFNKAIENNIISFNRYSYVSLFGINSLENLKYAIPEQLIDISTIGENRGTQTFINRLKSFSSKAKNFIPEVKGINFSSIIKELLFFNLNKAIICIDDIERISDGLKLRDVLGLSSLLKEQKDCKVVLIFNEKYFKHNEEEDIQVFRDKVIDINFLFVPTAEECAKNAISEENDIATLIREFSVKLNIKNIRIIHKIFRLTNQLYPLLSAFEEALKRQAIQSLTLFSLCYYDKEDDSVPDFEYVKKHNYTAWTLGDLSKENTKEDTKNNDWDELLQNYQFGYADAFDLEIASAVKNGFIDEGKLLEEAKKLNDDIIANKSKTAFIKVWRKLHGTFDDNEEDLVSTIIDTFQEHARHLSPLDLNSTVKFLRDIERDKVADDIIDNYIKAREDNKELFNLSTSSVLFDIDDKTIIDRFNEQYGVDTSEPTLWDVLSKLVARDSWSQSDIEILSKASTDDYFKVFTEHRGSDMSDCITICLRFGSVSDATEDYRIITKKASEALARIAKMSKLNAMRVLKYGITVD
jgi:hypothetical protein